LKIVVFGLSITSSWGNGHATTYRAFLAGLQKRGHQIVFFEKNEEWYASNRDMPSPEFCQVCLFDHWRSALPSVRQEIEHCDVAIVGSYFPEGIRVADELANSKVPIKIFYDIDTPITLSKLRAGGAEYLQPQQVRNFDLYLSFTGGPILYQIKQEFHAQRALPFYCSFEPQKYRPRGVYRRYQCDLSYMGTYAADRQPKLEGLFIAPALNAPTRKFLLAGPQYPAKIKWPRNVRRIKHLSPRWHPHFYSSSRLTLNVTRQAMAEWGFSPSVRLFEAAACACPIISDIWPGLDTILKPGEEVLIAENSNAVMSFLRDTDDLQLQRIGQLARERVLEEHSSGRRAEEFEKHVSSVSAGKGPASQILLAASTSAAFSGGSAQPIS
jgi:spore maturation protein CgeB